ncbi:hypothetical protein [Mycobacterium palustre]|uniref:hypothetical protein n=1 Tax=Mycobacterium palustre TaxID=153971 RepID=UPI00114D5D77|nr:hypothetical protein [Mycobacterium palustre]MCV7101528.1 hypothetical protein [Mycobacterium palustre]
MSSAPWADAIGAILAGVPSLPGALCRHRHEADEERAPGTQGTQLQVRPTRARHPVIPGKRALRAQLSVIQAQMPWEGRHGSERTQA